jgi:hypothetical protein
MASPDGLRHHAHVLLEDRLLKERRNKFMIRITAGKSALLAGCLMLASATLTLAQGHPQHEHSQQGPAPRVAQVVALDECDPTTFNAALGPDFCKNVALAALGFATTLNDLFAQGGEPHTFTEVAKFGGGFIDGLNGGQAMAPECAGGFANVAVARTRVLQASHTDVTGLKKGEHLFECCIHPWMRVKVEVK